MLWLCNASAMARPSAAETCSSSVLKLEMTSCKSTDQAEVHIHDARFFAANDHCYCINTSQEHVLRVAEGENGLKLPSEYVLARICRWGDRQYLYIRDKSNAQP